MTTLYSHTNDRTKRILLFHALDPYHAMFYMQHVFYQQLRKSFSNRLEHLRAFGKAILKSRNMFECSCSQLANVSRMVRLARFTVNNFFIAYPALRLV